MSKNPQSVHSEEFDYRISKDRILHPLRYGAHSLYQVGRMHCNRHTKIPMHTQLNYIELTVAKDGRASVITNGSAVDIKAGDIYISFPGDFHEIVIDERAPLKYDYITVMTEDSTLLKELDGVIAACHGAHARVARDDRLQRLVADAIGEINAPDPFTDGVMESLIHQLLVTVIRVYQSRAQKTPPAPLTDAEHLCLRLMNYVDNHIYTINSLAELTEISNYSYNYTSNLFKRVTGGTLTDYYQNRRLETAMLLLQAGQLSVTQIADMLNYSSIYSFSLAFKRRYGYPPSAVK